MDEFQRNDHASRSGVPLDVAQCLLRHAQNRLGAFVAKPSGFDVRGEFTRQARMIDEPPECLGQRGSQTRFAYRVDAHLGDGGARFLESFVSHFFGVRQLAGYRGRIMSLKLPTIRSPGF